MPRYKDILMNKVAARYWPTIKDPDSEEEMPDPHVLYVGPFIDGIVMFVPELLRMAFPSNPNPEKNARRQFKSLLHDASVETDGMTGRPIDRAVHMRKLLIEFSRPSWAPNKAGNTPRVRLGKRIRESEPGELLTSPVLEEDPETGEAALMQRIKGKQDAYELYQPLIREDKRYGLHYLLQGDQVHIEFRTRRNDQIEMNYELRPLGQSSLMTPEQNLDVTTW